MAFMQPEEYQGEYLEIETRQGTDFLPIDVCGALDGLEQTADRLIPDADELTDQINWKNGVQRIADYVHCHSSEIQSIELCAGTLYRLSAPGYLDCTEWSPEKHDDDESDDDDSDDDDSDDE